MLLKLSDIHK